MKKILLVLLFLLPFISACQFLLDEYLIEDLGNDDYKCFNNFDCTAFVPEGDSVWIELYSGDTLLEIDSVEVPTYFASLPNVGKKHEFRNQFTIRIHIFCNGDWLSVDYEFENRKDKYTQIELDHFDIWHEDTLGIQIFSDEQLSKCPELTGYKIFKNTNHPPSCFVPEISPNQHR